MDIIRKINNLFEQDLKKFNKKIENIINPHEELINQVANHLISSGGKKLRPLLTIICSKLCGYIGERHIDLALAVEFIHTATLLHDDVVDNSKFRRNIPTANNIYGNKSSILVGDFLLSQAFKIMVNDGSLRVLDVLSSASAIIAEGEVMQLVSTHNIGLNLRKYNNIIQYKTAELFAASCQIGALITKQNEQEEIALRNFGMNLGMAFQIIDDYLDYFSKDGSSGKDIGNDFFESKISIPIIFMYEKSTKNEKKFLENTFASDEKDYNSLDEILKMMKEYNIEEDIYICADRYIKDAKNFLSVFPESDIKNLLLETLDFSVKRVY